MPRYDFVSDNTAPATPEAMQAIVEANTGCTAGYGADDVTARAADYVRGFLDADAEVRFVGSGTAANAIALATLCRPFEAVLAHEHAHVAIDETGAPGFFGHGLRVAPLPGASGLIDEAALNSALNFADSPHVQSPAVLSLTNATEYGAVYSNAALEALAGPAKAKGLGVHLDGARLANAAAAGFDVKAIKDIGVDILIIGGAKSGMPPSEAIVIFNRAITPRFDARLKQSGQLPSKGRFYAAPFIGMLRDGAQLRHAAHANAMARRLAEQLAFPRVHPVQSNGVFIALDEPRRLKLIEAGWQSSRFLDGSVRFMCSWATTPEAVDELAEALRSLA